MSKPTEADLTELFKSLDLAVFRLDTPLTRKEDVNGVVPYEGSDGAPRVTTSSQAENELMAWADADGLTAK